MNFVASHAEDHGATQEIKMSNKANEELLNSLHLMTAEKIAKMLKDAEGDDELMLKVLREARGFLKDNQVVADVTTSRPVQQVEAQVKVAELPFDVEEE